MRATIAHSTEVRPNCNQKINLGDLHRISSLQRQDSESCPLILSRLQLFAEINLTLQQRKENYIMPNRTLQLFRCRYPSVGSEGNTGFETTPTEITEDNVLEVLHYDHTPILFKGGYSHSANFEYAVCIVFDIDNSHSDNPDDWITPEEIARRLKSLGINHWIVPSRNHLLIKKDKAPRPKFHVYLPLSELLRDSSRFVRYCKWCIETFGADAKVKSKAQKIFGHGGNPNAFFENWSEGRCVDEVLTDDDIADTVPKRIQKNPVNSPNHSSSGNNADFDWFSYSGEWRNHLGDLEAEGFEFFERDGVVYFQTPDGDHEAGKHDGNIKDGIGAYFFSKASAPFENDKGYSIADFFAGVLFGDIGKKGRAQFAERYLRGVGEQNQSAYSESSQDKSESPNPWQSFPLETFPPLLRNYVTEVSKSIGIDVANNAVCVLSIISGIIGRTFWLKTKQGYVEPAMLWVALIADSGLGKSPALTYAQEPVVQLQREEFDRFGVEMEQYDVNLDTYKQAQKQRKNGPLVGLTKPVKPVVHRYFISDCTTEAVLPILSENPYGVCLIRDELAAFFNGMDAYRSGGKVDLQFYIEIHGSRFVQSDRKKDREHVVAKTPSVSIVGGIQSDVIRQTVKREPEFMTTGFGARFLMAYPPAEPIRWNDNVVDPITQMQYHGLIGKLLEYRERFIPDEPGTVELMPEAKALIFDFQNRHADDSLGIADGNVRYVENKAGMHCARLCLTLHVVKCIESDIDPTSLVTPETMRDAITLTEWFLNEAHRIYAMFAGKMEPLDRVALLIKAKIRKLGGRARIQELRNCSNVLRNKLKDGKLEAKLKEMVDAGILTVGLEKTEKGRDKDYYRIANTVPGSSDEVNDNANDCDDDD